MELLFTFVFSAFEVLSLIENEGNKEKEVQEKVENLSFTFAPADSKYQIGIKERKQWRERKDHYFTCIPADCKISARSKKRKYRKTWRSPEIHIICTVCTRNLADKELIVF